MLSPTEMKILIYNKVKKGMDYEEAKKQLEKEMKQMNEVHAQELTKPKPISNFKEDFKKLWEKHERKGT